MTDLRRAWWERPARRGVLCGALALALLVVLSGALSAKKKPSRIDCELVDDHPSGVDFVRVEWSNVRLVEVGREASGNGREIQLVFDRKVDHWSGDCRGPIAAYDLAGKKVFLRTSWNVVRPAAGAPDELLVVDVDGVRSVLSSKRSRGQAAALEFVRELHDVGVRTVDTEAFERSVDRSRRLDVAPPEEVTIAAAGSRPAESTPSRDRRPEPGSADNGRDDATASLRTAGGQTVSVTPARASSRARLAQAKELYRDRRYDDVRPLVARLREEAAEPVVRAEAYYFSGLLEISAESGSADRALFFFARAAEMGVGEAEFYRGYVLFELGRLEEAREPLERYLRIADGSALEQRAGKLLQVIDLRSRLPAAEDVAGGEDLTHLVDRDAYARPPWLAGFGRQPGASLDRFRGRPVILHLWASWCAPCIDEMPAMLDFYRDWRSTPRGLDVVLMTVSLDYTKEALERFADRRLEDVPAGFHLYWDERWQVVETLGTSTALPQTLILDDGGKILDAVVGAQDWRQSSRWVERLERHLAGGPR